MKIKLVTIDFWNTLYDSSNNEQRDEYRNNSLIEIASKYNKFLTDKEIGTAISETWRYFGHHWKINHRTPNAKECVTHLFSNLGFKHIESDIEYVTNVFINSVAKHPPVLLEDAKDTVIELNKHFKIALISDTGFSPGSILRQIIKNDGLLDYFDSFSFSNETGVAKPHKIAFQAPLKSLNTYAKNAIHIGDIESTDVIGAKNQGMHAIRFLADKNNKINLDNPEITAADFELHSWNEVRNLLLNSLIF